MYKLILLLRRLAKANEIKRLWELSEQYAAKRITILLFGYPKARKEIRKLWKIVFLSHYFRCDVIQELDVLSRPWNGEITTYIDNSSCIDVD